MTFFTECDKDTEAVGAALASALERDGVRRAFIAMRGEMGVGKTAFTRGFAAHFGISGVKSPTYTVVNEYAGKCRIFHFDMYRITDEDELYSIGFFDYLERGGICLVEWSENIPFALPEEYLRVEITKDSLDNTDSRLIQISTVCR
jgi:tRNA threonylcarbamoyladenosine biosynthesis protein TsaE